MTIVISEAPQRSAVQNDTFTYFIFCNDNVHTSVLPDVIHFWLLHENIHTLILHKNFILSCYMIMFILNVKCQFVCLVLYDIVPPVIFYELGSYTIMFII